ncbi:unannotated protein [freshwater metagenome]|uniref:Unannotated protein n=1 Tax=freshwater metagenome TaxID=449393 RepID=A0A6J6I6P9_9ZZZZ
MRFGLRAEFWRAITPVMPRNRAAGRPRKSATGRAMIGPRTMVPIKTRRIPKPRYELLAPTMTITMTARPNAIEMSPPMSRLRPGSETSSAVARIAANGGTLPARKAGRIADNTVTMVPTNTVCCTVLVVTTKPPLGISIFSARNNALRPFDNPIPATNPIMDPNTPTASDSISIARVT